VRLFRGFIAGSLLGLAVLSVTACGGGNTELILATTTSTDNSGLLDTLIPRYEERSGDSVKIIPVGSGAAMSMGERGDADVLLVHSPAAELAFVDAGFGIERARVMFNDFIIVGPAEDPAGIGHMSDTAGAFAAIKAHSARFISRGDDSGTHAKEKTLWDAAGLEVPSTDEWYAESGQGMAATLTIAAETSAYTLTDRATWLSVSDPERLPLLVEGDERLFNVYHVIVVNPDLHDRVNAEAARRFRAFLLEPATQQLIGEFGGEQYGQPLFTPYASESD
jgi:tungstate transport system substrate-binding protein